MSIKIYMQYNKRLLGHIAYFCLPLLCSDGRRNSRFRRPISTNHEETSNVPSKLHWKITRKQQLQSNGLFSDIWKSEFYDNYAQCTLFFSMKVTFPFIKSHLFQISKSLFPVKDFIPLKMVKCLYENKTILECWLFLLMISTLIKKVVYGCSYFYILFWINKQQFYRKWALHVLV